MSNSQNPWINLSQEKDFVLPEDKSIIDKANRTAEPEHHFHLELMPEPYCGNPDVPIILLNANPGYSPQDEKDESQLAFREAKRFNLLHENDKDYPLFFLNPAFNSTSGGDYWRRHLKELIQKFGDDTVAKKVFLIEYYPYHSRRTGKMPNSPSQQYSIDLLRTAIDRWEKEKEEEAKGTVIILRKAKEWREAVPELNEYKYVWEVKSPQSGCVSKGNLPDDAWQRIIRILLQQ
jgi:hypothetical protein